MKQTIFLALTSILSFTAIATAQSNQETPVIVSRSILGDASTMHFCPGKDSRSHNCFVEGAMGDVRNQTVFLRAYIYSDTISSINCFQPTIIDYGLRYSKNDPELKCAADIAIMGTHPIF
jgi:hypothetical protein